MLFNLCISLSVNHCVGQSLYSSIKAFPLRLTTSFYSFGQSLTHLSGHISHYHLPISKSFCRSIFLFIYFTFSIKTNNFSFPWPFVDFLAKIYLSCHISVIISMSVNNSVGQSHYLFISLSLSKLTTPL